MKRCQKIYWVTASAVMSLVATLSYLSILRMTNLDRIVMPTNTSNSSLKVLLITYFRGGSTLLGEAFNRHPDAFYWFEPLAAYSGEYSRMHRMQLSPSGGYHHLGNGSFRRYPMDYVKHQADVIVNILNCKFDDKLDSVMNHYFVSQWEKSEKIKPFKRCLHQYSHQTSAHYVVNNTIINKCKPLIEQACRSSPIRAVKTIRVALYMLPVILEKDPDIKVIYYVRDPRASFVSKSEMWHQNMTVKAGQTWAEDMCHKLHEDHKWLSTIYNNSVLLLYYEKLAENFKETLNKVYSFVSLKIPDALIKWFIGNTRAGYDNSVMGTTRKNSTETATKWKSVIPEQTNKAMRIICATALEEYGYTGE